MRAFHENPNRIHTELTFLTLKAHDHKCIFCRPLKYLKPLKTNSVDPDQTAPVGAV